MTAADPAPAEAHSGTTTHPWPIVGHAVAVDLLARATRTGQVAHAYLITGPEGIGRFTLARTVAQALLCAAAPERRPCGDCSACQRVARGVHPDVSVISRETQAASEERGDAKHTRISIETIRNLRATIALRPMEGRWRVAIITESERLSRDAFDALLKTLEEPPPFVVLLLIATEAEALPDTIRSRCQPVPLEPLSRSAVAAELTRRGVPAAQATTIASLTRGRIGHALALAADPEALQEQSAAVQAGLEMIESPLAALAAARRLADAYRRGQRDAVERQLDLLLGLWRDLLLLAGGCDEAMVNADQRDRLAALARSWSIAEVLCGLTATYQALGDLALNAQPRLVLDHMVMQWPQPR
ncbi:MAG: DNA polymerase III subunit delta' [Sphaerobacter sp.]|nr:DNA polymerase III subunit delta' [Sphaerobacter sp.]